MPEPTNEPTPGSQPAVTPTPEPKPVAKKLEFTQEELDEKFKERQERGEKAAAKRLEAQYKAQLEEMSSKLKSFEDKDLTDVEKLKKEHEKASGKVAELTTELTGTKLENAKLKALIKAGVSPDQLDGLLKRVSGTTEEEILADVEELKGLGWIGQKPPVTEPPKGIGSPTKSGEPEKPKATLKEQIAEVTEKLKDPKLDQVEKQKLAALSISLTNRSIRGEV